LRETNKRLAKLLTDIPQISVERPKRKGSRRK
jgi:hypothetical protein